MHTLNNLKDFAINSIEPHFVRGDGKYPVKHHLYSHISFIIITRNKPSYEVEEAIKILHGINHICFQPKDIAI